MSGRSTLERTTVLDAFGWQQSTLEQIATLTANQDGSAVDQVFRELYGSRPSNIGDPAWSLKVALTLKRAHNNDPGELLNADWATRSKALADQTTIWDTYGADTKTFEEVKSALRGLLGPEGVLDDQDYLSTPKTRTI